jgi:hypothetical protein
MVGVHYLVGAGVLLRLVKSNEPEFALTRSQGVPVHPNGGRVNWFDVSSFSDDSVV